MMGTDADRIRSEYARRSVSVAQDFYSLSRPVNLFADQQRNRVLLQLLNREGAIPLAGKKILDVGCGDGQFFLQVVSWGARVEDLAGIDLIESRVAQARARFGGRDREGGPDLRVDDASRLPWPGETFDIAHQSVVFTSMTSSVMKHAVAQEILRVLKPGGLLIWYDFLFNNPMNPHVRGIRAREVRQLFPSCAVTLRRITLAPPIARRVVPITWIGSLILERLVIFNTHYLATIRKSATELHSPVVRA
jgi:ubiquinone/menaquinone biosynthesis C-methylase UbiE